YEDRPIPTDLKARLIRSLVAAGIRRIQIVSFVHPHRVPQMADAEQVVEQLGPPSAGVRFAGLALNRRGVERAVASGLREVDLSSATHGRHSLDNAGMTGEQAVAEAERMVDAAKGSGMRVQMGLQTVFGFRQPGDTPLDQVIKLCASFAAW